MLLKLPNLGEGASPLFPVPALDIVEALNNIVCRRQLSAVLGQAFQDLEIEGVVEINAEMCVKDAVFDTTQVVAGEIRTFHILAHGESLVIKRIS